MNDIIKIEKHLFENKNHTVRVEYRVFRNSYNGAYNAKNKLNVVEQRFYRDNGKQVFHF